MCVCRCFFLFVLPQKCAVEGLSDEEQRSCIYIEQSLRDVMNQVVNAPHDSAPGVVGIVVRLFSEADGKVWGRALCCEDRSGPAESKTKMHVLRLAGQWSDDLAGQERFGVIRFHSGKDGKSKCWGRGTVCVWMPSPDTLSTRDDARATILK